MALKDCIKKLSGLITKSDLETLQQYLDNGLSEDEAVERLLLLSDKDVIDIVARAKTMGAAVANRPDLVAQIYELRDKNLEQVRKEFDAIKAESEVLTIEWGDIDWIEAEVTSWQLGGPRININNDAELQIRLSQMFFRLTDTFRQGGIAGNVLKPSKGPIELFDNFRAMQERKQEINARQAELEVLEMALQQRVDTIFSGERRTDVLDIAGNYINESFDVYIGETPWQITSRGDGDLYIQRHGVNAGTVHRQRTGPNDFAISFDHNLLLPDYAYYLLQYLQPKIAARARGTQQAIRKGDITDVMIEHFKSASVREDPSAYGHSLVPESGVEAKLGYKAFIKQEAVGSVRTGIDHVNSAGEVAHLMAEIRRSAQEGVYAVVTDGSGKVINIIRHTKGGQAEAAAYSGMLTGAVLSTEGAKRVWFVHSHPGGTSAPSYADEAMTAGLTALMLGTSVKVQGHVIVATDATYSLIDAIGNTKRLQKKIPPMRRDRTVEITERIIRGRPRGAHVQGNDTAKVVFEDMGRPEGILLLDNRHRVLGIVEMSYAEMLKLREGQSERLLKAINETNASALLVFGGVQPIAKGTQRANDSALRNVMAFANRARIVTEDTDVTGRPVVKPRVLDFIYADKDGQLHSTSEKNAMPDITSQTFYQSPLGFTSGLLTAARVLPQAKGSGSQMLAMLKKQPGVTKREMDWVDLEAWLKLQPKVTQAEIITYIEAGGVQVLETQYGGPSIVMPGMQVSINENMTEDWQAEGNIGAVYDVTNTVSNDVFTMYVDEDAMGISVTEDDGKTWIPMNNAGWGDSISHQMQEAKSTLRSIVERREQERTGFVGRALWEDQWQLEGGTNYREVVMHLPDPRASDAEINAAKEKLNKLWRELPADKKDAMNAVYANRGPELARAGYPADFKGALEAFSVTVGDFEDAGLANSDIQQAYMDLGRARTQGQQGIYTSHTFDEVKNIVVWLRVKDRIGPNGEKIFFIEEVQGDWQAAGREFGYTTGESVEAAQTAVDEAEVLEEVALEAADEALTKITETGAEGGNLSNADSMARARTQVEDLIITSPNWFDMFMRDANLSYEELRDLITEEGWDAIKLWRLRKIELNGAQANRFAAERGIPNMPFKGNAWSELGMKRAIRLAAEGGYDQIAWTTGEQQADRYDLGQVVNSITWQDPHVSVSSAHRQVHFNYVNHGGATTIEVNKNGLVTNDGGVDIFSDAQLKAIVGEAITEKILGDMPADGSMGVQDVDGLRVGGEGKSKLYDEILVNVTNRAVRKLDKKAKVRKFGGGIVDEDVWVYKIVDLDSGWVGMYNTEERARNALELGVSQSRRFSQVEKVRDPGGTIPVHALDLTDDIIANALEGQTLFQPEKGSITFDEARKGVMRMTAAADLSTFLHEAGHLYLEVMRSLAEAPGAAEQIKADWATILDELEVDEGNAITREHHEKFANMFLLYTAEGKAPSLEMQDAFSAFRSWLLGMYKKIVEAAGGQLSPEITDVFDRMLASDEAIAQAENAQAFDAIFSSAEEMGVTPEQFKAYRAAILAEHNKGVDKETKRLLKAMRRDQLVWWDTERKRVLAEVTAEAHAMREYIALSMLQRGKKPDGSDPVGQAFKLDRNGLVAEYGKEWLKRLPGAGKSAVYRAKGGTNVDVAASAFGFKNGQELLMALIQTPKMSEFIKAETDARMQALYPDPMKDGTLAANAINTVHSDGRAKIMAIELRAIKRKLRAAQPAVTAEKRTRTRERKEAEAEFKVTRDNLAEIKAGAKSMLRRRQIRAVTPNTYLVAERKAGRLAFNAAAKGNYQTAYEQKRQQIVNHEMFRAATQASKEVISAQKYLKKFETKKVQQRMGKRGVLDKILAVIEGIDFRKISLKQVDRDSAVREMLEAVDDGSLVVPPDVMAKLVTRGTNWQDLTVEQFLGMRDIVKQIEHGSQVATEMLVNDEKVVVADAIEDFVDSLMTNNKQIDLGQGELTGKEKFKKGVKSLVYGGLSPGTMARLLDDGNWGALTRYLIVPIRRAYVEKVIPRLHKATEDVANLYKKHYSNEELADFTTKRSIEGYREDISKAEILSLAEHWGSEGNRTAVLGGVREDPYGNKTPAYTEQSVRALLSTLDSRDWAFIQDRWDYVNIYWPEVAAAEARRRGIAPEKVEASPFSITTSDGKEIVVKGGYMRLYYDRRHGALTKADEVEDYYRMLGNGVFVSSSTRAGSTHNRVKNHGRVVRLGLGNLDQQLSETIRDISLGDEIIFAKRLLNDAAVRSAFMHTNNEQALDALVLWLTDATVGELPAQDMWQKGAGYLRVGFVKSKLAFSSTVSLLQFTGFFQSMALVGKAPMMRGFGQFMRRPVEMYKWVMETSSFMETRYGVMQTFNVDISDTQSFIKNTFGPVPTRFKARASAIGHYYFWTIAKAQSLVDVSTWLGAKWKAENMEGLSGRDAILYADNLVEGAQTSGIFSDRTALERGTLGSRTRQSQFVRLWVTLIGYMLRKQGLAIEATHRFKQNKTIGGAATLAMDYMLLFVVEGIASQLIYGNWPEDDEGDGMDIGDLASWTAMATADSVVSGIPIIRETAVARYGSGNTAVGSVSTDMFKFLIQLEQGEADEAAIKMGVKVFGTLFHLPASQVNRAVEAYMSDDPEWYEWIMGVREE